MGEKRTFLTFRHPSESWDLTFLVLARANPQWIDLWEVMNG
jgi:hypothetical protein